MTSDASCFVQFVEGSPPVTMPGCEAKEMASYQEGVAGLVREKTGRLVGRARRFLGCDWGLVMWQLLILDVARGGQRVY